MDDNFKELDDKTTYVTMSIVLLAVMVTGLVVHDPRITLIGTAVVGVPVTYGLALLRHAWNKRSRRRPYNSPSTRRT